MQRIKALLGILVVVAAAYVAWQLLPPYYNNFQFQDSIESEARLNSYNQKTEQEIQEGLLKKARELDIPLTERQIKVQRLGQELAISADYTVHVDLPLYPVDLHFTPASKNKKIQ